MTEPTPKQPPRVTCPACHSTEVWVHTFTEPAINEAERYAPYRQLEYMCKICKLIEAEWNSSDAYDALARRWNALGEPLDVKAWNARIQRQLEQDDEDERAWTWPTEEHVTSPAQRATLLAESRDHGEVVRFYAAEEKRELPPHKYGYPIGDEYAAAVTAPPDEDAPRLAYANWLREQGTDAARNSAEFIEWQIRLAESYRIDPKLDFRPELPDRVFERRNHWQTGVPVDGWWRRPGTACEFGRNPGLGDTGLGESIGILRQQGLIDNPVFCRGFIEHVAMQASRFLELADELYALAPIRQLTLTYCKGRDHADHGLWRALLASPHLDRVRSLSFPVRVLKNEHTELNRLTDEDIELLAASPHVRRLNYLQLEDESHLTVRAFDALAASPSLRALSAVRFELYHYWYAARLAGRGLGDRMRKLSSRPLERYAAELEARHGVLPWLHVAEHYGREDPEPEAVIEHPIPRASAKGP